MPKDHFLEQHDPERKDFQIDRIILFTDAVFAIAITLLIIEIKAPEIDGRAFNGQVQQLLNLIPKFIGFLISFFVIAVYWRSHHRAFGFVNKYNDKLIWLNFLFLLTVVLMPFSSAYYSENTQYNLALYFYNANIILTGVANYRIINYIFDYRNNIVTHRPTELFRKLFLARSITIPLIFLFGALMAPFSMILSRGAPFLIWPAFILVRRHYVKKYNRTVKHENKENPQPETTVEE